MMDIKDDVNNAGDSETFQDWWNSLAQPWTEECAKTAAYQAWQQRNTHVTRLTAENTALQSELTKARELLTVNARDFEGVRRALAAFHKDNPEQCDGCQAGLPVEVNQYGTPLHRMGSEGGYPDYMACTAKLYTEEPVAWTSVNSLGFLDKRRNENRAAWRLNLSTHPLESEDIALYRHPQRPVVLPRTLSLDRKVNNINYNQGWNACIDEFERLNK